MIDDLRRSKEGRRSAWETEKPGRTTQRRFWGKVKFMVNHEQRACTATYPAGKYTTAGVTVDSEQPLGLPQRPPAKMAALVGARVSE